MMHQIFTAKHVVPQIYKTVLDEHLDRDWVFWEPETCWSEIERVFHVTPSELVANKLNALKAYLRNDLFYTDATVFENIVLATNDLFIDPAVLQVASPEEMVYAIKVLRPTREGPLPAFGKEIIAYVQVACKSVGLLRYPEELKFAQPTYQAPLSMLVDQIKPIYVEKDKLDLTNIEQVQGSKLYTVELYAAEKFARMDLKNLEKS
jgi:hypothetical protein